MLRTTKGEVRTVALAPRSVARFYEATMNALADLDVAVPILARPVEVEEAIPFFWGGPDLAVTRFWGRRAPKHPGGVPNCADWVQVLAYSHEVSSCGYWPGGGGEGVFYSYAYPEPPGFAEWAAPPGGAYYDMGFREFLLPYAAVRRADDPDATLLAFFQSTYEAAADLAGWPRTELEAPS